MSQAARDPRFGLFLIPTAESYPDLQRLVATAERAGLDLIGIQDHAYQVERFAREVAPAVREAVAAG